MALTKRKIEKNLSVIREAIDGACQRSRRDPSEITVLPVTKKVELTTVKHLLDLGFDELAESRAQQLCKRAEEVASYLKRRRNPVPASVEWHMIGSLQRNKVRAVLQTTKMIHSVDSLRLAEEISERAEKDNVEIDVLLQVNCSRETKKHGVAVGAALHLGEMIAAMPKLRLCGLMTMAAASADPETARPTFTRLRELFEEMHAEKIGGEDFRHLSMGMSNDYVVAVEEGATILRIGTALFE